MRRGGRRWATTRPPRTFAELAATVVPAVDVRVLRPGQSCPLDYRPTQEGSIARRNEVDRNLVGLERHQDLVQ